LALAEALALAKARKLAAIRAEQREMPVEVIAPMTAARAHAFGAEGMAQFREHAERAGRRLIRKLVRPERDQRRQVA
jgi:hypothetical protein